MKTLEDKHGGRDAGQLGWIWRRRRCETATEEMWDDRDGKMVWKGGDGQGKYLQGKNTNLRAYRCSRIIEMADKVSGEYRDGHAC